MLHQKETQSRPNADLGLAELLGPARGDPPVRQPASPPATPSAAPAPTGAVSRVSPSPESRLWEGGPHLWR